MALREIRGAAERIAPWVLRTPLVAMSGAGVLLKAESLQPSGSFKLRGAFNSLLQLGPDERRRGVVAHSSGNHAVAVAMAASRLGIEATIVMPSDAPAVKRDWTESLGATVELVGGSSSERAERAAELAQRHGLALVEPYDSPSIIAATGTIGLEILEDLDAVGTYDGRRVEIYAPVSGGGLVSGIAAAAKATDPAVRVIGVEPELAADALASIHAGERVRLPAADMARTIADGLRVQCVGELPWLHIDAYVDDVVTVSESQIRQAMSTILTGSRLVAEPSGAVAPAAAIAAESNARDDDVVRVAVLSGGNVDMALLSAVLDD